MSTATPAVPPISVVIPAYNEERRVGATVAAARAIPDVAEVIAVDDGSHDRTAEEAVKAGATVIRAPHRGKAAALRRGVARATGGLVILLDADLGESARNAHALAEPVRTGRADMTIAVLPAPRKRGGFGIALRTARACLWLLTGRVFVAPLSGQRCMTAGLARALPWGRGFGAEVAATTDAAALGARIEETPADLSHASTGRTLAGFAHRARQFWAVVATCAPRALYPIGPTAQPAPLRRLVLAVGAWVILVAVALRLHLWLGIGVAAAAAAIGAITVSMAVNQLAGVSRPNYLGHRIAAAGGVGFPMGPIAASGIAAAGGLHQGGIFVLTAIGAAVMAITGLADDVYGSREVSGLRGHIGSLARGRITTGIIKAVAGVTVGLVAGWFLAAGNVPVALLNAAVIALSTNFVNLLDVRPGRAIKGFLLLAAIAVATDRYALWAVGPIGAVALAFAPLDFGGRAMMGDAGANALGVAAGIALAAVMPLWGKLVLAAALVGIHLYSERRSLGEAVERSRALRWLDRLGRPEQYAP
ncbi:MAG: glycosyltransferase [Armatimonadota bacterium]|nr:MAG: glycosyltransferase [Armatimonadota bacterium]